MGEQIARMTTQQRQFKLGGLGDIPDTLAKVRSPNGFRERSADVDHTQLGAALKLVANGHGVGDHELRQTRLVDDLDGIPAQDSI